jgi:hypothetical protein
MEGWLGGTVPRAWAFRGQSRGMDPVPLLKTSAAVVLTLPLGIAVYRLRYWNTLTTDQQELLRSRRSQNKSSRIAGAVAAVVIVVLGTGDSIGAAPFWALMVAWAVTWPLAAASFAHWSLGLLKANPDKWRDVMSGRQRADMKSALLHILVALAPAAVFLSFWHA